MKSQIHYFDPGEGGSFRISLTLPKGILAEDNELGWREALTKLDELLNSKKI